MKMGLCIRSIFSSMSLGLLAAHPALATAVAHSRGPGLRSSPSAEQRFGAIFYEEAVANLVASVMECSRDAAPNCSSYELNEGDVAFRIKGVTHSAFAEYATGSWNSGLDIDGISFRLSILIERIVQAKGDVPVYRETLVIDDGSGKIATGHGEASKFSLLPKIVLNSDWISAASGRLSGSIGMRKYEDADGRRPSEICGLTGTNDERIGECNLTWWSKDHLHSFTLVTSAEDGRTVWKDNQTGLIWNSFSSDSYLGWHEAMALCARMGLALPSVEDYQFVETDGLREFDRYLDHYTFWTSTVDAHSPNSAFTVATFEPQGLARPFLFYPHDQGIQFQVRCVGR